MKLRHLLTSLLVAALGLLPVSESYALGSLGGSAFPLTFSTQPVTNQTDEFNQILAIINAQAAAATNSPILTVQDSVFTVQNASDATKQFVIALGGASTATKMTFTGSCTANCTITLPVATDTLAGLGSTQTFTGTETFSGTNTFTGAVSISSVGTLTATGTAVLASAGNITENGTANIVGALSISSVGSMTANGTVTVATGVTENVVGTLSISSAGALSENGAVSFGSAATIATQGIPFSNGLGGNPLNLQVAKSFTAATISAGTNVINSAVGRVIVPNGALTILASGTPTGATNIVIECAPSGNLIASFPISGIFDQRPAGPWLQSSVALGTAAPVNGAALVKGCAASEAVMISAPALATSTWIMVNMPYTVQ